MHERLLENRKLWPTPAIVMARPANACCCYLYSQSAWRLTTKFGIPVISQGNLMVTDGFKFGR